MEPLLAFPFAGFHSPINLNRPIAKNALLVPQAAVIEVQSMYQMVVVTPDNKASFRPIKVGEQVATNWIITEHKAGREGLSFRASCDRDDIGRLMKNFDTVSCSPARMQSHKAWW
jgi:multidrug efflux pump subunit AcrA (membrane-fusion protein)